MFKNKALLIAGNIGKFEDIDKLIKKLGIIGAGDGKRRVIDYIFIERF